jgi:hypothetical protein
MLAVAAEEVEAVFIPRVFRWKTGDLLFPAAGQSGRGRPPDRKNFVSHAADLIFSTFSLILSWSA